MGAGSLGTVIGAFIAEKNEDVVLIDVNEAHVKALNESGARVTGTIEKTSKVTAMTPEQMTGHYDLILLLTKQYFNAVVLSHLLDYMNETSLICSLQNGVPEEEIAAVVGRKRVVAGSVEFGATYLEPGISELTSDFAEVEKFAFMIGEIDGSETNRLERIKTILDDVGNTVITNNLIGTKWSKLVINASMSGLSTALNCTYGDIAHDNRLLEYAVRLIDETVRVGHAAKITFVPVFGLDFNEFIIDGNNLPKLMESFKRIILPHSRLKASMLQDLEKGKQTEIKFINGVIADSKSIATPYNDLIVDLVKEAEQTKTIPDYTRSISKVHRLLQSSS